MSCTGTGFDSSPIKGEGDSAGCVGLFTPPCGYCLEASMTVWWDCLVFTLTPVSGTGTGFDTLSSRERGILAVVLACVAPPPHLWIDESPITLCQRVRLQRGRTSFFIVLVPMNGRIKSAMTWRSCPRRGYCLEASMTVGDAGDEDRVIVCGWVLRFLGRQRSWGLVRSEIVLLCELGFAVPMRR